MKPFFKTLLFGIFALNCASAMADNVFGTIKCDGVGVANVPVSDGFVVTYTDANGYYSFQSDKKNGYVFYSLPSGYEPTALDTFKPQFWAAFTATADKSETHNFALKKVDNSKFNMIFGADSHLANINYDRTMYNAGYIKVLKQEKADADSEGRHIYSTILGDLSWDNYWYSKKYNLSNFMTDNVSYGYPLLLFPVMGNHDNDGAVAPTDSTDFLSSKPWRTIVCPNYYSYNLGKVHFVVLDDIYYKNEDTGGSYSTGIVGSRNYTDSIVSYEVEWLKKDLSTVDKNSPVIVCIHIPAFRLTNFTPYGALDNYKQVADCFAGFKTVHFMSGHTHYNYCSHPTDYPNIEEHNIAAICACWWRTGRYNGINTLYQVCQDGSPAGYSYWTIDGDSLRWEYKSIAGAVHSQMRVYDMNTVKTYFTTDSVALAANTKNSNNLRTYAAYANNAILANVYAYDNDWQVTMTEGVDKPFSCFRVTEKDPYFQEVNQISIFRYNGNANTTYATVNAHMFRGYASTDSLPVTVKAIDSFGGVHYKTFQRPLAFNKEMIEQEVDYDLGDINTDGDVNVTDVSVLMDKVLGNNPANFQPITADLNGDRQYNVSDLALLVNKILGIH